MPDPDVVWLSPQPRATMTLKCRRCGSALECDTKETAPGSFEVTARECPTCREDVDACE